MNPRALFISFFDSDAANIIKNILSLQVCSNPPNESDKLISYPYEIDTKYYTSLVDLCTFDPQKVTKDDISKALIEDVSRVEAFVGYFSTNQRGSFLHAAKCSRFMKESNSNVKILVCDQCMSTDEISRQEILKWCIENGFELVELHDNDEVNDDDDDDDEDDFKETKGVQRIIEALRCNSWSNMVLKDRSTDMSPYMRQLRDEMDDSPTNTTTIITTADQNGDGEKLEETMKNLNVNADNGDDDDDGSGEWKKTEDSDNDDDDSDDSDDSEDDDDPSKCHGFEDNFENLFKNISQMKEEASSLPFEERKKYAENVVKKFWYSIGGNGNEFDDDDEEDEAVN